VVDFDVIREMVSTGSTDVVTVNPCKMVRDAKNRTILSKGESKDYRIYISVYNKRVIMNDYIIVPYGY